MKKWHAGWNWKVECLQVIQGLFSVMVAKVLTNKVCRFFYQCKSLLVWSAFKHPPIYLLMVSFCLPLELLAASCVPENPTSLSADALIWQVTKGEEKPDYIFGTMHHGGDWVEAMIDQLEPYMDKTRGLVVEIEVGQFSAMDMMDRALLPAGKALSDFFTPQTYATIKEAMIHTVSTKRLSHLKPWYVFVNLRTNARETVQIMDTMIEALYQERSLPIEGLESVLDQIEAYDALSLEQQAWMVERAIETPKGEFSDLSDTLKGYYQTQNLSQLWEAQNDYAKLLGEPFARFNVSMLKKRSLSMSKKLVTLLDQDEWFVAVGAFHLLGESGLVCQLEQAGYQVQPVEIDFIIPEPEERAPEVPFDPKL